MSKQEHPQKKPQSWLFRNKIPLLLTVVCLILLFLLVSTTKQLNVMRVEAKEIQKSVDIALAGERADIAAKRQTLEEQQAVLKNQTDAVAEFLRMYNVITGDKIIILTTYYQIYTLEKKDYNKDLRKLYDDYTAQLETYRGHLDMYSELLDQNEDLLYAANVYTQYEIGSAERFYEEHMEEKEFLDGVFDVPRSVID